MNVIYDDQIVTITACKLKNQRTFKLTGPNIVKIDRSSKWGNPFVLKRNATEKERYECVKKYADWITKQDKLMTVLDELIGKTLVCWCYPKLCHGHVLSVLIQHKMHQKMMH